MSEVTVIAIGARPEPLPDIGQAGLVEIASLAELCDAARAR